MAKILILGSTGMLGHVVCRYLSETSDEIETISRSGESTYQLDVSDFDKLESLISRGTYDYVVNCVGVLVKESSVNAHLAVKINSLLPLQLDNWSLQYNFKFIHISTDCVFSGNRGLYSEYDLTDALDSYGKSKSLGENLTKNSLVLRTSIIGPEISNHRTGLMNWVIQSSGEIEGYSNVYWNGLTTLELAKVIKEVCEKPENLIGIYSISCNEVVSKYNLVSILAKIFNPNLSVIPVHKNYSNKSLVSARSETFTNRKSIEEQLVELLDWY